MSRFIIVQEQITDKKLKDLNNRIFINNIAEIAIKKLHIEEAIIEMINQLENHSEVYTDKELMHSEMPIIEEATAQTIVNKFAKIFGVTKITKGIDTKTKLYDSI